MTFGLRRSGRLRLERCGEIGPSLELTRRRNARPRVCRVEFGAFDLREKAAHVLAHGPWKRGDHRALALRTMPAGRKQYALATMIGADDREVAHDSFLDDVERIDGERDTRFVE